MDRVEHEAAAVEILAESVRAILFGGNATAADSHQVVAAPNRRQSDGHTQVKALEADCFDLVPEAVKHLAPLRRFNEAVTNRQAADHRRREVVQLTVLAFPPRQPAGLGIQECPGISRFEAIGPMRIARLLLRALQLLFQVAEAAPGAIDQRIAIRSEESRVGK